MDILIVLHQMRFQNSEKFDADDIFNSCTIVDIVILPINKFN